MKRDATITTTDSVTSYDQWGNGSRGGSESQGDSFNRFDDNSSRSEYNRIAARESEESDRLEREREREKRGARSEEQTHKISRGESR